MSDSFVHPQPDASASRSRRGQSLVEFALILPLLLVLLLGIADFGRVFSAGITVEASARNAAELAAQEYLRNPPGNPAKPMTEPAPEPGDADYNGDTYYPALHALAANAACREMRALPNTTYDEGADPDDPADDTCFIEDPLAPDNPQSVPMIMVCVHDGVDPFCDVPAFGESIPSDSPCTDLRTAPENSIESPASVDGIENRYVEVRVCYHFTTLFQLSELDLPLGWGIGVGDIFLQKQRTFTVGFYPPDPTPTPAPPPPPPPPGEIPTPTPSPTPDPSETPSESPTPTPPEESPVPNPTPTPTPDATPAPTPEDTPAPTPEDTPTPTPTPETEPAP